MDPRIETRARTVLVGMFRPVATDGEGTPELWRRFMPRRGEVAARGPELIAMRVFHRTRDEPLTHATPFDEWAAVEVSADAGVPAGMERYTVPSGTYAVFIHRGLPSAFPQTARFIFETWLPRSGYVLDDRPHLAVMGPSYHRDDPEAEEEIWVPVRER